LHCKHFTFVFIPPFCALRLGNQLNTRRTVVSARRAQNNFIGRRFRHHITIIYNMWVLGDEDCIGFSELAAPVEDSISICPDYNRTFALMRRAIWEIFFLGFFGFSFKSWWLLPMTPRLNPGS